MGQLWSSQAESLASHAQRGKKASLRSQRSGWSRTQEQKRDTGLFSRNGNHRTARSTATGISDGADDRPLSLPTSHRNGVDVENKGRNAKKEVPGQHGRHKDTPKVPKSSHSKSSKAEGSKPRHRLPTRRENHHHHHDSEATSRVKKECMICTDTVFLRHFPTRPPTAKCSHEIDVCRRCLRTWIESQFRTKMWDNIVCPICPSVLKTSDMRDFAPSGVLKRYLTLSTRATLEAHPQFIWCGLKSCPSGQVHASDVPKFRCKTCKKARCIVHHVKWHKGETCKEYEYRTNTSLKAEEEEASRTLLELTTKICPGCGRSVERIDGCDHMECTKCRAHFCWMCLTKYPRKSKGRHDEHAPSCLHY